MDEFVFPVFTLNWLAPVSLKKKNSLEKKYKYISIKVKIANYLNVILYIHWSNCHRFLSSGEMYY